jgi:hypothetical protein
MKIARRSFEIPAEQTNQQPNWQDCEKKDDTQSHQANYAVQYFTKFHS